MFKSWSCPDFLLKVLVSQFLISVSKVLAETPTLVIAQLLFAVKIISAKSCCYFACLCMFLQTFVYEYLQCELFCSADACIFICA